MPQAATFDDVWGMFQEMVRENQERNAETNQIIRETSIQIKEVSAQMRETDREVKEVSAQMRETDRKMQETDRKMQETDRKMQETDRQMQETDRKVKEVSLQIGRLGGRWGEFVEGMVAPSCETLFAERGIPVHKVSRQVTAKLPGGRHMEIDVFVVNTDAVVLVEVKSALTVDDIRDHLVRLGEFKDFFPEYAAKRVFGAVAGIVIGEHVNRFAMNNGLFVMVQAGDALRVANDTDFIPRTW